VDVHGVLDVPGVAAGHRHGDGDAPLAARFEHQAVALREALLAYREAAQPVVLEGVGPGEVDRQLSPRRFESPLQPSLERVEELSVVRAVREGYI
jgi:hypothetical protein